MRPLLVAALVALAAPAAAHPVLDLSVTEQDTHHLWFDAPNTTDLGDARIRIVFNGHEGAAALTPNQFWHYKQSYRRHIARLALHRNIHAAERHARVHAFRDVVARYPNLRVEGFDLKTSYGDAFITPDL